MKTLKELKDEVIVVSSSELEQRTKNTIISNYDESIDKYILNFLNKKGSVDIPTLKHFLSMNPDYSSRLKELYVEKMEGFNVAKVDEDTMVAQAALFDSLCFVYDSTKDTFTLATMNFELLYDCGIDYDMLNQVLKKNASGIVKAYRVDLEYNGSTEFTFKVVNARDFDIDESKSDEDEDKRFYLVPYAFIPRIMYFIQGTLDKGSVIKVKVHEKVRLITQNKDVLSAMCDIPSAVDGVQSVYFPLKGFFYAPSVGAPSTSSMVTNIDVFNIDMLKIVTNVESEIKACKIHKPVNPTKDLVAESLVCNTLMRTKNSNIDRFTEIVDSLPKRNLLPENVGEVNQVKLARYLHSLPEPTKKRVYKLVGVIDEIERRSTLLGTGRAMTEDDLSDLEIVLKNSICKIIIRKKDGKLSSIFCTNSTALLSKIYGKGYVGEYEGFSVKFRGFYDWLKRNRDANTTKMMTFLHKYGLPYDEDAVENVFLCISKGAKSDESVKDRLFGYFAEREGINIRSSKAQSESVSKAKGEGTLLVRTLNAYKDVDGNVVDYYRNVDKSKVVSGIVFE